MKRLLLTTLLSSACILGTSAQSIRVTDSKDVVHKFAAERVKDITFMRPLKNGSDNNSLPFQDHFCLKKGNYRG